MIERMCRIGFLSGLRLGLLLGAVLPCVAAGEAVLTEFLADNSSGLVDEDGDRSDWIEISNPGAQPVPLGEWALTDRADGSGPWKFPAITLAPGERLIVFASGKNRRDPGSRLHTDFRLGANGEYLALIRPDGRRATEFAPAYPPQLPDISFGLASRTVATSVVTPQTAARVRVPVDGSLGTAWRDPGFDDASWAAATAGLGFETGENEFGPGVAGDVLADGPLVFWRLSETVGTTVASTGSLSATGQVLNGAALGHDGPRPPVWPGFESGNAAASFDGLNDKIDVAANPAFNPPSFTIEAWARPEAAGGGVLRSVVTCRNSSPTRGFALYAGDDGRWQFWLGNGTSWSVAYGPEVVIGRWTHLAGSYDSATQLMKLFVNGVPAQELTSAYAQNTTRPLRIGAGRTETAGDYFFSGAVDEVALFDRALEAEAIARRSTLAATGTGSSRFPYAGLYPTDLRPAMHGVNSSVYVRVPFDLAAPEKVSDLTLRVRHDDGLAVWINGAPAGSVHAPAAPSWNATATAVNPAGEAQQEELIDLSSQLSALRPGRNVLALQGLNVTRDNPDFLLAPRLEASVVTEDAAVPVYFTTPTPGKPNTTGAASPGPLITGASYVPAPPNGPTANDDITVTCRVSPSFAAVAGVTLTWRIMFTAPQQTPMVDDGRHGDGAAGDGIFGAVIPKTSFSQGQLVRWFFTATDTDGRSSRWPLFTSPTNSPEFLGTMIADPRVSTALPVWYWFAQSTAAANTRTGTRGAVFFNGILSDNVLIRQRGAATSSGSRKFDFNTGHHAFISNEVGRVEEANINGTSSDPTLVRPALAFETFRRTGAPAGIAFPLMLRANAAADTAGGNAGLAYFVEQVDERLLDRVGLDRDGALYKFDQRSDLNPVFTDATNGVQKRTRLHEGTADLQAVVNALRATTSAADRERFMFDAFDVGNLVNYLAVRAVINDADDVRKNFYFYRDTNDSGEWMLIPWDKDWSFGVAGDGGQWWTHPFFGDQAHPKDNANQWNRLWDALHTNPRTRAMYLRRLRTLMDTVLQPPPPAPPGGYDLEKRADAWFAPLDPHTAQTTASIKSWLPQRRNQLFVTFRDAPTNTNAARRIIPATAQDPEAVVTFGEVDPNPSSGNQDEEFVELVNPGEVAIDVSGWKVRGGIDHTLRPGSVILPGTSLFLANRASAFRARATGPRGGQGLLVQGNYNGSLSARGETLMLIDPRDPATAADDRVVATTTTPARPTPAQAQLRITELMFHPAPGGAFDAEEYEFIELTHIGEAVLDLTGTTFTDGITFTFAPAVPPPVLAPGARLVLVKNPVAFAERYGTGRPVAGTYDGSLSNRGERLRLVDAVGEEVLDFSYADDWQPGTDGGGYSLVIRDPAADPASWSDAARWRVSLASGGSPGTADAEPPFRTAPGDLEATLVGAAVRIDFLGAPLSEYRLESGSDLVTWQPLAALQTDAAGRATHTDPEPAPGPRFYRVRSR